VREKVDGNESGVTKQLANSTLRAYGLCLVLWQPTHYRWYMRMREQHFLLEKPCSVFERLGHRRYCRCGRTILQKKRLEITYEMGS